MPSLSDVVITFNTHGDNKNDDTILHVFVKNRLSTSLSPEQNSDFISNRLAFDRYQGTADLADDDSNPYLALAVNLAAGQSFDDPSSHTFHLTLRSNDIDLNDIVLPVVNIHILTDGSDVWMFDYVIAFVFDDGQNFTYSSANSGAPGIILDQHNRNFSGICRENPLRTPDAPVSPVTDAMLSRVTLELLTHDYSKDPGTVLDVNILNRLGPLSAPALALGVNLFAGEEFPTSGPGSSKKFIWSTVDGDLAHPDIRLADIVLPVVNVIIQVPGGNDDRWAFDYQVTFEFVDPNDYLSKPAIFESRTNGIVLDQDNYRYSGVYQGRPFPTVTPPTAPLLTPHPVDHVKQPKIIPLEFLRQKFDEFINDRNGDNDSHNPPLNRVRLHNAGLFQGGAVPESYLNRLSITAGPPSAALGGRQSVNYFPGTMSLGQLPYDYYLNDINSSSVSISVNADQVTPFTVTIEFETGGGKEFLGGPIVVDAIEFSISLLLTLDVDRSAEPNGIGTLVDTMSWAAEIAELIKTRQVVESGPPVTLYQYNGMFLHAPVSFVATDDLGSALVEQVVKVTLVTSHRRDPGGILRQQIRDTIFSKLTTPDAMSGLTIRDSINSMVTSWLLGGVADNNENIDQNNIEITDLQIEDDNIRAAYTGPRNAFVPPTPPDWPTATHASSTWDFSPGNLANIDHIVVLMMENRSFDHILGYLSLPIGQGGMGRTDVDGLTGSESNPYRGTEFPVFRLTGTYFSPDPPHGHEPVTHAIDNGKMDGFVQSYADAHGAAEAGKIMGHHTGATVPQYDALARDFTLGHRWFSSHPGPTFCNRFYELTGRLNLDTRGFWEFDNSSPLRPVFTPTIFDYLAGATDPVTGQPVTWAYFENAYCFLRFFEKYTFDSTSIRAADDPESGFFALARAGQLPSVSFIDPHFVELPPDTNCDGPPSDIQAGQAFVQQVVEAVVASPAWDKTMLVLVYDEHGGFYDHVPPPAAVPVSVTDDFPITTYGVRVPSFVISPWVGAGTVFGHDAEAIGRPGDLHFDHTSIIKTIARRFLSAAPPYMGARYAAASDLSAVMTDVLRQPQFLPFIRYNLQYAASQLMMDVQDASPAAETPLWQFPANGTVAQDFSFEDAGDGLVYIRSHVSNLYLTVDEPGSPPLGVIQDVKYLFDGTSNSVHRQARQKWQLTNPTVIIQERHTFLIESHAFAGLALQPAGPDQAESLLILADAGQTTGIHARAHAWNVTSPLFSGDLTNAPG
ncbi:MAG TPA: alkaline phosphatase family protein [Streptosporangiaceae bacterium]